MRYYEKLGVLPAPERSNGCFRIYSESDIQLIIFINSLKKTGMPLKDIKSFLSDGCILQRLATSENISVSLEKRIEILTKHKIQLERQKAEIDNVITITCDKLDLYYSMLENGTRKSSEIVPDN